jgi:hypothetical protein
MYINGKEVIINEEVSNECDKILSKFNWYRLFRKKKKLYGKKRHSGII